MPSQIKHVVMAEDDNDDIELFKTALNEECPDLELSVAEDGAKLIKLLGYISTPDVILLDLNMPCKDGKECLVEIRGKKEYDEVPIVILSTSSNKKDIEFCLSNGANHYFIKPNSYREVSSLVKNICDGDLQSNIA
ncbi:response regulator [Segetibacter sp. 3557_3]|nr:response regulator [Segetibacter sp. 3557_3]